MHVHRTAVFRWLVGLLVAGAGVAAANGTPPAVQAENTTVDDSGEAVTLVTGSNATVGDEGRFAASFTRTTVPDETEATLVGRGDGNQPVERPVRTVAEPTPTATANPTPSPAGTSSDDGPGFGALPAFAAVPGTALVVARRA